MEFQEPGKINGGSEVVLKPKPTNDRSSSTAAKPATLRVLLADCDTDAELKIRSALAGRRLQVVNTRSLTEARDAAGRQAFDLAFVNDELPDGSGIAFAADLRRKRLSMQTIVTTHVPSMDQALAAMRAGASDYIAKPFDPETLQLSLSRALERHHLELRRDQRIRRLRKICRKLTVEHDEVSRQVDVLCSDLVSAYHELAAQMEHATESSVFAAALREELDLEALLRKTLEHLLQIAGPTNAAVYLPTSLDEYALGGYVNYECTRESADVLLQHLADVIAPTIAESTEPIHITSNKALTEDFGDDAAYLEDAHMIAFAVRHDDEVLAVIIMYRDHVEPFAGELIDQIEVMSPILADHLAKVVRVHHRRLPMSDLDL